MEAKKMNTFHFVEKNLVYSLKSNWIVDPFGTVLSKLAVNGSYALESNVISTWWGDDWQIKLNFTCKYSTRTDLNLYGPGITLNKINSQIQAGAYNFRIAAFKSVSEKIVIYVGSALPASFQDSGKISWVDYEPLKLEIEIMYFPFKSVSVFNPMSSLRRCERLASFQEEKALLDFTICVGGQELKTNKTVLALVSPVFLAMFSHDFEEKQKQTLHIEDTDVNTIQKFLDFAYTGQSPNFEDAASAVKLYHMAEKYQVQDLKNVCFAFIHSLITDKGKLADILMSLRPDMEHKEFVSVDKMKNESM